MTIASTLTGAGYEVALMNAAAGGYTWAGKPAATAVPTGTVIRITDAGVPFLYMVSDGTRWVPAGAQMLGRSAAAVSGAADTADNTLATIALPAGAMGINGMLRVTAIFTVTNSANAKTVRLKLGGTQVSAVQVTTVATEISFALVANRGAANSQTTNSAFNMRGDSTGSVTATAVDTSVAQNVTITGQKASAGEIITLESYTIELLP